MVVTAQVPKGTWAVTLAVQLVAQPATSNPESVTLNSGWQWLEGYVGDLIDCETKFLIFAHHIEVCSLVPRR